MNIENLNDWEGFYALWTSMLYLLPSQRRAHDKEAEEEAIKVAFAVLSEFDADEVFAAIHKHLRSERWVATPADIVGHILGKVPSYEAQAGMARAGNTPLGVYIRSLIGTHDILRMNDYEIISRVKLNSDRINNFIERAQTGNYTPREIAMQVGANCDPAGPLCVGLLGPRLKYRASVREAAAKFPREKLSGTDPVTADAMLSDQDRQIGRESLAKLLKTLNK